jgi:uracil-DNA glycosylase family 4
VGKFEGFFADSAFAMINKPVTEVAKCGLCKLHQYCQSPKMEPTGKGKKGILIVGEAPGADEDDRNRQFVGKAGRELQDHLRAVGIEMREDCWLENALRCHPKNNFIKDRKAIEYCRPNVMNTLKRHDPSVILLLGGVAVESVIGHLWKEGTGGINRWAGFKIPCRKPNAWIIPETRWIRRKLGIHVRNWIHDGMLATHVLDCRPRIASLKFQAFIRRGQEDYDGNIKPYMKARKRIAKMLGANSPNRIDEVELRTLLSYGGLDSLHTYHIGIEQMQEMG